MKNFTVARRYARALYELAEQTKVADEAVQGLGNLVHAVSTVPELKRALINPLINPEQKKILVSKITSNKLVLEFIFLLAKRDRLADLELIYDELRLLSDQAHGISRVLVKTPSALSEDQKKSIEKALAQRLGHQVVGRFDTEQHLIGGVWMKIGDRVLDASLKGRIEDLRHTLMHSNN